MAIFKSAKTIVLNILGLIVGLIIGSLLNMYMINLNGNLIELPAGVDLSTTAKFKESLRLFEPKHFIFPFLGHAIGSLVGAFFTFSIAASYRFQLAMSIGLFFLFGGIYMIVLVGGPFWFMATDLLLAYIPMAWIGIAMGKTIKRNA